jgi:hypothetical protein
MRVHDLIDETGRVFAFEVSNTIIGRRGACAIVNQIRGSKILRGPRFFSWFREDQFCAFEVNGQRFVIEEPFGDNSRYWIGPEPPLWCEQVDAVRQAFLEANPFLAKARTFERSLRADRTENRVRHTVLFVCGALIGLVFGFYALIAVQDLLTFAGGLAVFSVSAGFLSARFGGRFWEMISHLRWLS